MAFRISNEAGKQRKAGKVPQVIVWKGALRGQGWAIPEKDKIRYVYVGDFLLMGGVTLFCC